MTEKNEQEELSALLDAMEGDPSINRPPSIAVSGPSIAETLKPKAIEPKEVINVIKPRRSPAIPPVGPKKLTRQQEINIAVISYHLFVTGKVVDQTTVFETWPTSEELKESAGPRPTLSAIQHHMTTPAYRQDMIERGIAVDVDIPIGQSNGLTAEQISVLSHLSDTTTTKGIPSRLKELGVKPATYRAWLRQKPFNDAIRAMAGNALQDAIPMAETMLSAQAQAGDLRAIKFLFEVTGRHDPARQQAVDTQALVGVIIDCIQEVLGREPELLKELIDTISVRSKGVKGVLG